PGALMSTFHCPDVRPRALHRPLPSDFVTIGVVEPVGSPSVIVAPAIGCPVALSVTTPCTRSVPRTCASAANDANSDNRMMIDFRMNPPWPYTRARYQKKKGGLAAALRDRMCGRG